MSHQASPLRHPWMLTWAPPGMRSTSGKPGPGPALKPADMVTMPGAASAAVGASSKAAVRIAFSFMTRSSSRSERPSGASVPQETAACAEEMKLARRVHSPFMYGDRNGAEVADCPKGTPVAADQYYVPGAMRRANAASQNPQPKPIRWDG